MASIALAISMPIMSHPDIRMTRMNLPNYIFRFWAKTSHDRALKPDAFHPLICPLIDVAVTTESLWNQVLPEITKKRLSRQFGLQNDLVQGGCLISFLAGLHDFDKCSPPFTLRGKNDDPAPAFISDV